MWFDTHAHLQDDDFAADRPAVLERAIQAGISRILLPASDLQDSRLALEMARQNNRLFCAVGCHPHTAADFGQDSPAVWHELIRSGYKSPIVALGEIGLDYHYDLSPRPIQQDVFRLQLDWAYEFDLPVIIHEREAAADCLAILKNARKNGRLRSMPGVCHCFSGSVETAEILLDLGFYLGFDGPVTFRNARKPLDVIEHCPHDRLLLETDSPYLTPVPYRGRRNEPAYIPLIGAKIAEIWQISLEETARLTTKNAERLFQLPSLLPSV